MRRHAQALETAFGVVRDGTGRVGVPQYTERPIGFEMLMRNIARRRRVAGAGLHRAADARRAQRH
ncbi:MAG TPA: hypothetical protein VGJ95_15070, partial [Pseudonocardiaceae bacterium]